MSLTNHEMSKPKHPSQLICLALAVPVTNNRSRGQPVGAFRREIETARRVQWFGGPQFGLARPIRPP